MSFVERLGALVLGGALATTACGRSRGEEVAEAGRGGRAGDSGAGGRSAEAGTPGSDAGATHTGDGGAGAADSDAGTGGSDASQAGRGTGAAGDEWGASEPACPALSERTIVRVCATLHSGEPADEALAVSESFTGPYTVESAQVVDASEASRRGCYGMNTPTEIGFGALKLYVEMPELPPNLLAVGERVELDVIARSPLLQLDQTIIVRREGELVLFGVNAWAKALWPNVREYDIRLTDGDAYCAEKPFECGGRHKSVNFEHAAEKTSLIEGETKRLGDVVVSVEVVADGSGPPDIACDPPGDVMFGGFVVPPECAPYHQGGAQLIPISTEAVEATECADVEGEYAVAEDECGCEGRACADGETCIRVNQPIALGPINDVYNGCFPLCASDSDCGDSSVCTKNLFGLDVCATPQCRTDAECAEDACGQCVPRQESGHAGAYYFDLSNAFCVYGGACEASHCAGCETLGNAEHHRCL